MEYIYGCDVSGDGCGTGKTHAFTTRIRVATRMWERLGTPVVLPTLVVCTKNLFQKTYDKLHDRLGDDWHVYQYGAKVASAGGAKLLFDKRHAVYRSANAGRTVVVAIYSQLQAVSEQESGRDGLLVRIILDEAQMIQRCDQTKQGRVLKSFNARYKFLYSGSLGVDTMLDIDGYLAFLQRPE